MNQTMTGMDFKIRQVAERIRELREISGFTVEEMAQRTDLSVEEYIQCETGNRNLSIAFLYRCTLSFGVDFGDLLEGNVKAILAGKWARAKAMHVSAQAVADTTFKGCRVEVGSNGKTFRSADPGKVEPWQNKGFQLEEVLEERVAYVAYAVNAEQVCADADYENKVFIDRHYYNHAWFSSFLLESCGIHSA